MHLPEAFEVVEVVNFEVVLGTVFVVGVSLLGIIVVVRVVAVGGVIVSLLG